ncbi:TetR/AcrR family transcriptional regulator [Antribacter gilvus]|uniref:TetR/AcrR family transcriptional regulator n=1 Tax=Antribacter gilvus TaxID=2304675 RepID=UPI000F7A2439|nr:TetR/AcrR family transcriptional regulator [Antribacter gilvus]
MTPEAPRPTQADRRAATRVALLESTARHLSRYGYGNLVLEQVAKDAGYTRGALYHQFKDKQELVLATWSWVIATMWDEVIRPAEAETDPVAALLVLARGHAVFCRRDIARLSMVLRIELSGQDHPVGREVERSYEILVGLCTRLIAAGRENGGIPDGPPDRTLALAVGGALDGVVVAVSGQTPHDELLAARAVAGVLGIRVP